MEFHFVPNPSISANLNETVRFPTAGLLDTDYLIQNDQDEDVAKARVVDGVIRLFAVNADLDSFYRAKVKDLLLRAIVMDADAINANLSIDIQPEGFDPTEMIRFFEQFGFRRVTDTIMKRNAGTVHPVSMAESDLSCSPGHAGEPIHDHTCSACKFVGVDVPQPGEPKTNQVDMYVCQTPRETTLLRRYSSEPSAYGSWSVWPGEKLPTRYQRVADSAKMQGRPVTEGEVIPFHRRNREWTGWYPTPSQLIAARLVAKKVAFPSGVVNIQRFEKYIEQNQIGELITLTDKQLYHLWRYCEANGWENLSVEDYGDWVMDCFDHPIFKLRFNPP